MIIDHGYKDELAAKDLSEQVSAEPPAPEEAPPPRNRPEPSTLQAPAPHPGTGGNTREAVSPGLSAPPGALAAIPFDDAPGDEDDPTRPVPDLVFDELGLDDEGAAQRSAGSPFGDLEDERAEPAAAAPPRDATDSTSPHDALDDEPPTLVSDAAAAPPGPAADTTAAHDSIDADDEAPTAARGVPADPDTTTDTAAHDAPVGARAFPAPPSPPTRPGSR